MNLNLLVYGLLDVHTVKTFFYFSMGVLWKIFTAVSLNRSQSLEEVEMPFCKRILAKSQLPAAVCRSTMHTHSGV